MCAGRLIYNISKNGVSGDWYWEVITPEGDIMARGLAATSTRARADAVLDTLPTARPVPIQRTCVEFERFSSPPCRVVFARAASGRSYNAALQLRELHAGMSLIWNPI